MTKEEAKERYESKFWESKTHFEIFDFQLNEPLLCMPFSVFHEAAEKALGRSVWTHEFAFIESLKVEWKAIKEGKFAA